MFSRQLHFTEFLYAGEVEFSTSFMFKRFSVNASPSEAAWGGLRDAPGGVKMITVCPI